MTSKTPIFPMPEHYSDYGFDPQIDYFQVLEEARRHSKREARSLDSIHFKLQKPISKDDHFRRSKSKKRAKWWRNALLFWKWKSPRRTAAAAEPGHLPAAAASSFYPSSPYGYPRRSVSGPVYATESSGSWTPCRRSRGGGSSSGSRPTSGPLRVTTEMVEVGIPYLCLRDLTSMDVSSPAATSPPPPPSMPIYLVT